MTHLDLFKGIVAVEKEYRRSEQNESIYKSL